VQTSEVPVSYSDYRGQNVLITGAGHGIGQGIAEAFADSGATVVVADRDPSTAEGVAALLTARGASALPIEVDVRSASSVNRMVERILERLDRIDVLVNNAGIYPNTPVLEMDETEWDAVFDTNVKGVFLVTRAVVATMVAGKQSGRIINISSGAAESGRVGAAHYCSSKAAVNMLTRVLALEFTPHGITVNAVAPGLIEVPDWDLNQDYIDAIVGATPAGRLGQPRDVASVVLFLAGPASGFITGSVYAVDGGTMAGRPVPWSSRQATEQVTGRGLTD
jgi:3-oxoacyl-[acyl-carrier protein] reductase